MVLVLMYSGGPPSSAYLQYSGDTKDKLLSVCVKILQNYKELVETQSRDRIHPTCSIIITRIRNSGAIPEFLNPPRTSPDLLRVSLDSRNLPESLFEAPKIVRKSQESRGVPVGHVRFLRESVECVGGVSGRG